MGLFIGASALTVFEIIDVIVHSLFLWSRLNRNKGTRKSSLIGVKV